MPFLSLSIAQITVMLTNRQAIGEHRQFGLLYILTAKRDANLNYDYFVRLSD